LHVTTAEAVHTEITTYCRERRVPVLEETLGLVEEARLREAMEAPEAQS
jgi:hypothetical protein